MTKKALASCLVCTLAVAATAADGVEVKLTVKETQQVARSPGLITMGVPFARGAVKDVAGLAATLGGRRLPAQFSLLAPWDDGSVRWALMHTQADVPAGGSIELTVSNAGGNPLPAAPVRVDEAADAVTVSTGPLQFSVSKTKPRLFQSLKVDGKELLTAAGRGLVVVREDGKEVVAVPPSGVKIEQAGPMRAVICLRGKFPAVHRGLLAYTVRIAAFAGRRQIKVHAWLENQGAMGYWDYHNHRDWRATGSPNAEWFKFSGMHVELGLALGNPVAAACGSARATGDFKVLQVCRMTKTPPTPRQVPMPPYFTWDDFEYTITSGDKELAKGDRTDGVVRLSGTSGTLVTAIRDFWQNYDKAVERSGEKLKLCLWPTEGQWPRARTSRTRVRTYYDKNLDALHTDGHFYYLQGGVHKGHEFVLDFSGRDAAAVGAELNDPLLALASAEYYAGTEAAPGLFAPPQVRTGQKRCDARLDAWVRMTRSLVDPECLTGLLQARQEVPVKRAENFRPEESYWFGWMDYGDIPVPGHGPVSLHYDWTWIMLLNVLRTGDPGFMKLASPMARHRIDIDQLWSDRDEPEFRGLQRDDSGYSALHCYRLSRIPTPATNWLTGVVLYYVLTGEPKALECCRRNAEGLRAAWSARRAPRWDMAAHAWTFAAYCAMYDLTADRKWLEDALALFRTNVTEVWKAEGPFLHDPDHQIRQQTYVKQDVKYCYAIAALCNLHRHTGDKDVLKLLTEGCDREFPDTFFESPKFLSDLYAYVGHVTGNADYLKRAAGLFARGFTMSRNPPVILPGSSTWSRTAATTLQTGHVLQYAYWKKAGQPK